MVVSTGPRFSFATMDDGDHGGSSSAIHSDSRFIVATTLATLVVAGSTYIWRSNPKRLLGQWGEEYSSNIVLLIPQLSLIL